MTEVESIQLGSLAGDLFPKSRNNANLIASLVDATDRFPFEVVRGAMLEHQRDEDNGEFISVPAILRNIRKTVEGNQADRAADRLRVERAAALERRRQEEAERRDTHASVTGARAFCQRHPDRLDEWRAEVLATLTPGVRKRLEPKAVADSTLLTCLIFERFGTIPKGCGL